jgi:8-oxo-dGTP pyrophosphatase MutT (NUDIX family)
MIDAAFRTGYRAAHMMLRTYWFVRRPETRGALVAAWYEGRILLVETSYRRTRSLPGGYIRRGESPKAAAARELREEIGMDLPLERFEHAYSGTLPFEHRADCLDIFEVELDEEPRLGIDRREVVWAGLVKPEAALGMRIVPHLREYLERRARSKD